MPRRARRRLGGQQGTQGPLTPLRLPPQLLAQLREGEKSRVVPVTAPWRGFMPDLDPQLLGYNVAMFCVDCVAQGDFLAPDDGFAIQGTLLPFAVNQPLTLTHHFYSDITVSPPTVQNLVCTQAFGTGAAAGHLYTQAPVTAGTWTEVPFSVGTGFIGAAINAPAVDGNFACWVPDFCTYPDMSNFGNTINGAFIFTNGNDVVYQYPDTYTYGAAIATLTGTPTSG